MPLARRRAVLGLAVSAAVLGLVAPAPVAAGCAGPGLVVPGAPTRLPDVPGPSVPLLTRSSAPLVVTGLSFAVGPCDDTPDTSGCTPARPARPVTPAQDVDLVLQQEGRSWVLGTADATVEGPYAVRWEVVLPGDLRDGPAVLTAGTAELPVDIGPAPG